MSGPPLFYPHGARIAVLGVGCRRGIGQQAMEASLSLGRKPGAQLKQGGQDQEIAGLGVAAAEEQNNEGGRERRHPHPDGPTHPSRKDDTEQQEDRGQQEGKGMGEGL